MRAGEPPVGVSIAPPPPASPPASPPCPTPCTSSDPWRVWSRALRQATERVWGGGPGTCLGVCLGRGTGWPEWPLPVLTSQDGDRQWAFDVVMGGVQGTQPLPLHVQAQLLLPLAEPPGAARPAGARPSAAVPPGPQPRSPPWLP